ncbi:hypothetical protein NP493_383g04081 [Ridgeia piscesae]|uniref:protein-tyrosine-phosphatase n=1 Tax=Ridgeia piscesae TaxID=27915 RepID=A0AAD9NVT9_RIDPI|nr:hypothetical protein NP493_383g04081 [Ridgeia piscesae]
MDKATYTCATGYQSDGQQHVLVCSTDAKWEGDKITCTEIASTTTRTNDGGQDKANNVAPPPSTSGITIIIAVLAVTFVVIVACIITVFVAIRRRRSEKDEQTNPIVNVFKKSKQGGKKGKTGETGGDGIEDVEQGEAAASEYVNLQLAVTYVVAVGDLVAYVDDKKQQDGFRDEYGELPRGIQADCKAAKKQANLPKNRFKDILPYDKTRVILETNDGKSDYINANHVMGYGEKEKAYIACQGPKDTTIEDMWRMIWQENSNIILMLANLRENGRV